MINFEEYDDEKLLNFVWMWVNILPTHTLYPEDTYEKAILEVRKRGLNIKEILDD